MSRSYRHPYAAITGVRSAAHDKMVARRSHRRAQNQELQRFFVNQLDWDGFIGVERYEASFNDVWGWGRDGNQYLHFLPSPPCEHSLCFWWSYEQEQSWYELQLTRYQRLHRK